MLRRVLLSLALGLAAICVHAQTAPSPADVGISKGTPDVFKLKGHDNAWTPFGSVDPTTHIFAPGTNGPIAPNDCLKWGPGITSAGMACGSGGGGGGSSQLTIYTSHSGLVNNVTTPTEAWTVQQQGFYAAGDGGAATYQWNFTSKCPLNDNTGLPNPADGVYCVLPIGQSPSVAGRYLLQLGNGIDVRQIGMVGDGVFDNSTLNATLMNLINPANSQGSQSDVFFPAKVGQRYTDYYFSKSFNVYRPMNHRCQGVTNGGGDASARIIVPAGIHGIVFDNYGTSPDGTGVGSGGMSGCGVVSEGYHEFFPVTAGSNPTITVPVDKWGGTWNFHVGDGIIAYLYSPANSAPAAPPGTVVTATNPGSQTITVSPPIVSSYTGNGSSVRRLPVEDAFTVNITSGSPNVTVTGGPSLLMPGDYIWSSAFPLGTVVRSVSGTIGAQTVSMTTFALLGDVYQNATATQTGGHMWLLPAGLKTFVQTSLHTNYFSGFAWGLEMQCSDWATPTAGCNASLAQENSFYANMIGRLVIGNNSGASIAIMDQYKYSTIADIAEMGSVGSNYFAENSNSAEDSTSLYGAIGLCVNSNSSSFFGGYIVTNGGYCMNGIGVATSPGGTVVFWNPIAAYPSGSPTTYNGNFYSPWSFGGPDGVDLCLNQPSDALKWSHDNAGCGGGGNIWQLQWRGDLGAWTYLYFGNAAGQPMWLTESNNYTGYQTGLAMVNFPQGLLLNDHALGGGGAGAERLVDEGTGVPTETWHKPGDIHFNQIPAYNGHNNLAWINSWASGTTLGAAVTSGATTSVPVSSCPSPVPPVGTPILDYSNPTLPPLIATLASCVSSTLTFQAAATHNAANGDTIVFSQWFPAGVIADDPAGTKWTLGNTLRLIPVAIASLPTCNAGAAGSFAVVNNGAAPTYGGAVGTTGAVTSPVFCTGSGWTYH